MKAKLLIYVSFVVAVLAAPLARAQVFTLPTLSSGDTDAIFRTMAADLAFRPVQPATDMGLWGFSIGVSGTMTSTSDIQYLIGSGTPNIYAGEISGTIQLPFGLAVEAGVVPGTNFSNTTINQFGFDVKWTITRDFLDSLPFDVAARGMYTNASASYTQPVSGTPSTVSYSSNMSGGMLSVSKDFLIINPFIGYGFVQHNSTLSSSNSGLFGTGFAGGTTSTSGSGSSGWFQLGAQLKVGLMTLAAEYDNLFSVSSYSARVALAF